MENDGEKRKSMVVGVHHDGLCPRRYDDGCACSKQSRNHSVRRAQNVAGAGEHGESQRKAGQQQRKSNEKERKRAGHFLPLAGRALAIQQDEVEDDSDEVLARNGQNWIGSKCVLK